MTQSKILGITGLSGSGKTTVTRILEKMGAYAVIADELAHNAIRKGNISYDRVLDAFGHEILDESGEIDRKKLGVLVFKNPARLKMLESVIHPYVIEQTWELIGGAGRTGRYSLFAVDAPMLIEAGLHTKCHAVWLVTAPEHLKIERITARDGITPHAAKARLSARNEDLLKPFADIIIVNDGSLAELEEKISRLL